jgi:hypothetical protein
MNIEVMSAGSLKAYAKAMQDRMQVSSAVGLSFLSLTKESNVAGKKTLSFYLLKRQ